MTKKRLLIIGLAGVVGVAIAVIGFIIWFLVNLRPVAATQSDLTVIEFTAGESTETLAAELKQKGVIRNAAVFSIYTTITNQRRMLQAGTYEVKSSQSTPEVVRMIAEGDVASNVLLFTEGSTTFKLRELLKKQGRADQDISSALGAQYTNAVLGQRPAGASLEGYLFPDTYQLPKTIQTSEIIQQMLDNFERKLSDTDFTQKYSERGLSLHQAVTLASIVDREVRGERDQAMVAQLYLNRLQRGMMLQADPTAIYGAELAGKPTQPVRAAIEVASPYNTYKAKGLPPGPIGNPGITALKAVAYPTPNEYLYFISDKNGTTRFAKTYEEHQRNIERYLN